MSRRNDFNTQHIAPNQHLQFKASFTPTLTDLLFNNQHTLTTSTYSTEYGINAAADKATRDKQRQAYLKQVKKVYSGALFRSSRLYSNRSKSVVTQRTVETQTSRGNLWDEQDGVNKNDVNNQCNNPSSRPSSTVLTQPTSMSRTVSSSVAVNKAANTQTTIECADKSSVENHKTNSNTLLASTIHPDSTIQVSSSEHSLSNHTAAHTTAHSTVDREMTTDKQASVLHSEDKHTAAKSTFNIAEAPLSPQSTLPLSPSTTTDFPQSLNQALYNVPFFKTRPVSASSRGRPMIARTTTTQLSKAQTAELLKQLEHQTVLDEEVKQTTLQQTGSLTYICLPSTHCSVVRNKSEDSDAQHTQHTRFTTIKETDSSMFNQAQSQSTSHYTADSSLMQAHELHSQAQHYNSYGVLLNTQPNHNNDLNGQRVLFIYPFHSGEAVRQRQIVARHLQQLEEVGEQYKSRLLTLHTSQPSTVITGPNSSTHQSSPATTLSTRHFSSHHRVQQQVETRAGFTRCREDASLDDDDEEVGEGERTTLPTRRHSIPSHDISPDKYPSTVHSSRHSSLTPSQSQNDRQRSESTQSVVEADTESLYDEKSEKKEEDVAIELTDANQRVHSAHLPAQPPSSTHFHSSHTARPSTVTASHSYTFTRSNQQHTSVTRSWQPWLELRQWTLDLDKKRRQLQVENDRVRLEQRAVKEVELLRRMAAEEDGLKREAEQDKRIWQQIQQHNKQQYSNRNTLKFKAPMTAKELSQNDYVLKMMADRVQRQETGDDDSEVEHQLISERKHKSKPFNGASASVRPATATAHFYTQHRQVQQRLIAAELQRLSAAPEKLHLNEKWIRKAPVPKQSLVKKNKTKDLLREESDATLI